MPITKNRNIKMSFFKKQINTYLVGFLMFLLKTPRKLVKLSAPIILIDPKDKVKICSRPVKGFELQL